MPTKRPLLTIAIPTYNRCKYLAQLLTVLAPQLKDEPRVELIISDNSSSDDTRSIVESFQHDGLQCHYIRNEANIGPDANFLKCFDAAEGEYLWIFADDDIIVPSGVKHVLECISAASYDIVYVSSYGFTGDLIPPFHLNHQPRLPEVIAQVDEFVCRVHIFFTLISGNIVNKNNILAATARTFSSLVGTNLVQLGWTYTALRNYRSGLYIHEKVVAFRLGNTGGYGLFKVFGENLQSITDKWLDVPRLERLILNGTLQAFFPYLLLSARESENRFVKESPHDILSPIFKHNFRYWLFDYPVIVLPLPLARIWVQLLRIVNKVDRTFGGIIIR